MKHFGIKVLLLVTIGLCALPRTYAQDTTITIYGKRFAPGVIVKINGVRIDSVSIRHDNTQPSRILYVTFPLSMLQKPATAVAEAKGAGATLTSDGVENTVSVGNPGNPEATYATFPLYVKPKAAKIAFVSSTSLDTLTALRLRVPLGSTPDTLIRIQYQGLTTGAKQIQFSLSDTTFAQIYDSLGNVLSSINISNQSGLLSFRIRFKAFAQLPTDSMNRQIQLRAEIKTVATLIGQKSMRLEIFPVRIRYVVTAAKAAQEVYKTERVDKLKDETLYPADFFSGALRVVNGKLDSIQDALVALKIASSKLAQTRFAFRQQTKINGLVFQDPTNWGVHFDLDRTPPVNVSRLPDEFVIMISNFWNSFGYSPYRAIASSCTENIIPDYIIVEARYARNYIDPNANYINPQFWQEIADALNAMP